MHYIPNTLQTEQKILKILGIDSFEQLISNIPKKILYKNNIDLPEKLSEFEISKFIGELAKKNKSTEENISFIGGGSYDHFIPAVVDFLISRSEFYTAYTPYQAEVSQGTLQAIYEFQSLICQLMDMDVANASMYDGATAIAEAALMAVANVRKSNTILVSPLLNPSYLEVLETYLKNRDIEIIYLSENDGITDFTNINEKLDNIAGLIVQSPNYLGNIEELSDIKKSLENKKTLFILASDPIGNTILKSPGELGADIAVAEGQSLGLHQAYGGPYLGIFSTREKLVRKMPGRIVGKTEDAEGAEAFTLVLQTREQHIRREKATSNICSNQGLMALAATIYLSLLGKNGLKEVANLCLNKSHYLAEQIEKQTKFKLVFPNKHFFKEFVIKSPVKISDIISKAKNKNIFPGIDLGKFRKDWDNYLLIAVTEKRTKKELDNFVKFLSQF